LLFFQIRKDVARDLEITSSNLHRKNIQSETFLPSGKNQLGLVPTNHCNENRSARTLSNSYFWAGLKFNKILKHGISKSKTKQEVMWGSLSTNSPYPLKLWHWFFFWWSQRADNILWQKQQLSISTIAYHLHYLAMIE
jgi:hypothetical protein